ncbi:MAG: AraC family transcriptional regulator ligand-binding domain-containing protein [Archangium sp.]|nr:AraC family transcriptional regulator ligand-binding domain-containing protein [Archangium sp.]
MGSLAAKRFSSSLVPFVLTLVRKQGLDPAVLEKKYLHLKTATGQGAEVSLSELEGVLEDAAKLTKDPLFGLHAALAMPRGSYGLLEFALRCAPTARKAIEQLARYGVIINPLVRWSVEVDGNEVSVSHRPPRRGGVGRQGNVFTVTRILQIAREMLGPELTPRRAWFAHEEKTAAPELAGFLKTSRIGFGRASNGVAFSAKDLDRAPAEADADLNRALEVHGAAMMKSCHVDDVLERTRAAVIETLPKGQPSLAAVAKRLHVGDRTLQRRLSSEGLSFATLLAQVRRERAERLLEASELSVTEVAKQVGYVDVPAFVRAFRGWTGTTPGAFRERVTAT